MFNWNLQIGGKSLWKCHQYYIQHQFVKLKKNAICKCNQNKLKNSNARMIGNLHKVEVSNYRAFCLENENQSHRFIQMCDHIKRCKLEFLNKIRFSEGQLYLIAPIFDQKKKKMFNILWHYFSTS